MAMFNGRAISVHYHTECYRRELSLAIDRWFLKHIFVPPKVYTESQRKELVKLRSRLNYLLRKGVGADYIEVVVLQGQIAVIQRLR